MSALPEVPGPIADLRSVMERARETQTNAGWVVNMARYEVESDDANQEFLKNFMAILPVQPSFIVNNRDFYRHAPAYRVVNPIDLRPTSTFGLFVWESRLLSYAATLIVGERMVDDHFTEVLTMGWQRDKDSESNWSETFPVLRSVTIPTKPWHAIRSQSVANLYTAFTQEEVMSCYSSNDKAFVITQDNYGVRPPISYQKRPKKDVKSKRLAKQLSEETSVNHRQLTHIKIDERTLRNNDFEQFNVMLHMEYIAAAYGVGEKLDGIKVKREAALPPHPAIRVLGLPSEYRSVIEQSGVYLLPVSES